MSNNGPFPYIGNNESERGFYQLSITNFLSEILKILKHKENFELPLILFALESIGKHSLNQEFCEFLFENDIFVLLDNIIMSFISTLPDGKN